MDQNTQQSPAQPSQSPQSPQPTETSLKDPSPTSSQNYVNKIFSGRLNRRNYFIGCIILAVMNVIFELITYRSHGASFFPIQPATSSISAGFALVPYLIVVLFVNISLAMRRLHDLNKTGWLMLVLCIPLVGAFYGLYVLFAPGTVGDNKYGSQPLPRIDIKQDILRLS